MSTVRKFEDFECWQLARKMDKELFPLTKQNGFERDFKLKDQILGSSGSIMDNISEGFGRRTNADFCRFLSYSHGSCDEIKSQLYRALDRAYINQAEFKSLYDQATVIAKKVGSLMSHLDSSGYKPDFNKRGDQALTEY
jgi:four helix bundle protein